MCDSFRKTKSKVQNNTVYTRENSWLWAWLLCFALGFSFIPLFGVGFDLPVPVHLPFSTLLFPLSRFYSHSLDFPFLPSTCRRRRLFNPLPPFLPPCPHLIPPPGLAVGLPSPLPLLRLPPSILVYLPIITLTIKSKDPNPHHPSTQASPLLHSLPSPDSSLPPTTDYSAC